MLTRNLRKSSVWVDSPDSGLSSGELLWTRQLSLGFYSVTLKALFSWATVSFSRRSVRCGGGVSSTDFWLHVAVELIECLLFSGIFLVHISASYPDCGLLWYSSTLSSKCRIIQRVPLSAEPTRAASISAVLGACRGSLHSHIICLLNDCSWIRSTVWHVVVGSWERSFPAAASIYGSFCDVIYSAHSSRGFLVK
jgi:hypothetical protein